MNDSPFYFMPYFLLFLRLKKILVIFIFSCINVFADKTSVLPNTPNYLIDGIEIQAVENLKATHSQSLNLALGIYPFNPYYNAFAIGIDTAFFLSENVSWKILHLEYFYTVDTSLRTDLANLDSLNPTQIDRLKYSFASELIFDIAHGKFVMFDSLLRDFDFSFILGAGMMKTTSTNGPSVNLGLRLVAKTEQTVHWVFELEDQTVITTKISYVIFRLGTGIYF